MNKNTKTTQTGGKDGLVAWLNSNALVSIQLLYVRSS